jgi:hypothetical protein
MATVIQISHWQCQSHVTINGQLVGPSWRRVSFGAHDQIIVTVRQSRFCRYGGGPVCHLLVICGSKLFICIIICQLSIYTFYLQFACAVHGIINLYCHIY